MPRGSETKMSRLDRVIAELDGTVLQARFAAVTQALLSLESATSSGEKLMKHLEANRETFLTVSKLRDKFQVLAASAESDRPPT